MSPIREVPLLLLLLTLLPVPGQAAGAPRPHSSRSPYQVLNNLFARAVGFDATGNCRASRGKPFRNWRLPGFPGRVPTFESCTTIRAKQGSREVEFVMRIVDASGRVLQKVDGVLALSDAGLASQAVTWEHLEIPRPGRYHFEVWVEGKLAGRKPMLFTRARPGTGKLKNSSAP